MPATAAARANERRLPATSPSPEGRVYVARTRSRLLARAASLAFPTEVSGTAERAFRPSQWRGRTGLAPVSVAPVRLSIVARI